MRLRRLTSNLSVVLLILGPLGCSELIQAETKGETGLDSSSSSSSSSTSPTGESSSTSETSVTASGGTESGTDATASTGPGTTTDPSTSTTTDPGTASDTSTGDPTTSTTTTTGPACVDEQCDLGVCIGDECGDPPSCLALHEAHGDLGDGTYTLDPDGPGGEAPIEVDCDMLEGGWSCVYFNDFEGGSEGWSKTDITTCDKKQILGGFDKLGKDTPVTRLFALYGIPHTELRLDAVLYAIDSWDKEDFRVELDGESLYSKKCNVNDGATCNHNDDLCGWPFNDGVVPFTAIGAHAAEDATLHFSASLNEGKKNESFGLDDVRVCIK